MAKSKIRTPYTEQAFEKHVDAGFKALIAQSIAASNSQENPHEVFNRLIKEQHGLHLYKSGKTKLPSNRAFALHVEAERRIKHSSKLWRNMQSANSSAEKPNGFESHHIVAAREPEAELSRKIMFSANIGINDARNGINISSQDHKLIHKKDSNYYSTVNFRMAPLYRTSEEEVGNELVDIGLDIQEGLL